MIFSVKISCRIPHSILSSPFCACFLYHDLYFTLTSILIMNKVCFSYLLSVLFCLVFLHLSYQLMSYILSTLLFSRPFCVLSYCAFPSVLGPICYHFAYIVYLPTFFTIHIISHYGIAFHILSCLYNPNS